MKKCRKCGEMKAEPGNGHCEDCREVVQQEVKKAEMLLCAQMFFGAPYPVRCKRQEASN